MKNELPKIARQKLGVYARQAYTSYLKNEKDDILSGLAEVVLPFSLDYATVTPINGNIVSIEIAASNLIRLVEENNLTHFEL